MNTVLGGKSQVGGKTEFLVWLGGWGVLCSGAGPWGHGLDVDVYKDRSEG